MLRADHERHERDAVSLMGGLLILLIAALFLVSDLTDLSLEGRWTAPVVLLSVGLAGLLGTLRPRQGESEDPDPQE